MLHKLVGKSVKSKAKGPQGAINYLAGFTWRHSKPELLRGNLDVTRELLDYEDADPYTHGVLSFEENALDVSQDAQDFAMNLFEETLMAGFPQDHYDIVWIRHDDKEFDHERGSGRLELNYHIVNRDLVTGKKISPYLHKYDMHRVNIAKKIINDKFKFSSPDDPARAREVSWEGYGSENKGIAKDLNEFVLNGIQLEQVDSRDDIIRELKLRDDIEHVESNKSQSYLVVKMKNRERKIRLKGTIYGKKFTSVEQLLETTHDDSRQYHRATEERLAGNIRELQRLNQQRVGKREQLIKPIKKRGRKPKSKSPEFDKNNHNVVEYGNGRIEKVGGEFNEGCGNPEQQDTPVQPSDHSELSASEPSSNNAKPVHGQVPNIDSHIERNIIDDRVRPRHVLSVLEEVNKPKVINHESQFQHNNDTNIGSKKTTGAGTTIQKEERKRGGGTESERPAYRVNMGSIQRAAIYFRELKLRVTESIRANFDSIRANFKTVQKFSNRTAESNDIGGNYDEINKQCDELNQLIKIRIKGTLTPDNKVEINRKRPKF